MSLRKILSVLIIPVVACGTVTSAHGAPALPFPEFEAQGGLGIIGVLTPWGEGATGAGVPVAILDTGVRLDHVDLAGNLLPGFDFVNDDNSPNDDSVVGHGTQVAGIVAALRNGFGTVGVAYDAKLIPVKVQDQEQIRRNGDMVAGINFALANGARILNLSMQGDTTTEIENALINAAANGTVIVLAAGNQGSAAPTRFSRVAARLGGNGIIVGSVDTALNLASFSNQADGFADHFMVAPGVGIQTTLNTSPGAFSTFTGTSASVPFVSGAAAVLMSAFPNLTGAQIVRILLETASDLGEPGVDPVFGHGLLNLAAAMSPAGGLTVPGEGDDSGSSIGPALLVVGGAVAYAIARNSKSLKKTLVLDKYDRGYIANITAWITVREDRPDLESLLKAMDTERGSYTVPLATNHALTMSYAAATSQSEFALLDGDPFRSDWLDIPNWAMSLSGDLSPRLTYQFHKGTNPRHYFSQNGDVDDLVGYEFITDSTFTVPYLGFGNSATGTNLTYGLTERFDIKMGFLQTSDDDDEYGPRSDAAIIQGNFQPNDRTTLNLQFGELVEYGSMFGGASQGLFSVDEASTTAVGVSSRVKLNQNLAVFGSYSRGITHVSDRASSVVRDVSTLRSESYGIGLSGRSLFKRNDRYGIAVSRPLRVTNGNARLDVPTAIDAANRITIESETVDLSPAGRETALEAFYKFNVDGDSEYGFYVLFRNQPYHDADLSSDLRMYMTYTSRF